jgi:putative DNA methylase
MASIQAIIDEVYNDDYSLSKDNKSFIPFPEIEANELAKLESYNKHLYRPNTYLHKWWARRSGTTFRYILKQLVNDKHFYDYYTPGGLKGITILDPMMGGGTTLHEAIRLEANVIGYDIDPIPVLQARASLINININEKKKVFNDFFSKLFAKLNKYFITSCPICGEKAKIKYTLYGTRKRNGDNEFIVVDSLKIREEDNKEYRFNNFYENNMVEWGNNHYKIIDKSEWKHITIDNYNGDIISLPFKERFVPLIIAGDCSKHSSFFKAVDQYDIEKSFIVGNKKISSFPQEVFRIPSGPKSDDLIKRNIKYFFELFSDRQLLYISEAKEIIQSYPDNHKLWLTLLLSTSLEFNSMLCGYKGANIRRPGAVRHVFSHHAYSIPYTSLENNPIYEKPSSGNLQSLFRSRIINASQWAIKPIERCKTNELWKKVIISGESDYGTEVSDIDDFYNKIKCFIIEQRDSSTFPLPDRSIDFIVTDPPYLDSVQYSDLSNFFRSWLQWCLPDIANWNYDVLNSAVAENEESEKKFGKVLEKIWKESNRVIKRPFGKLIFTYHHWRPSAWAHLSISLKRASFKLVNAYVVHSENPTSVHIVNVKSLQHDAILELAPSDVYIPNRWEKPIQEKCNDSSSFIRKCNQTLGWILETELSEDRIHNLWKQIIEGA